MIHDTEAHDAPDRSPHQVQHAVSHRDIALAINRTGGADEGRVVLGEIFEANFFTVDFWLSLATMLRLGHGQIGHGVALGTRWQLMPVGQKGRDDLAAGLVGVGNEYTFRSQARAIQNSSATNLSKSVLASLLENTRPS